MFTITKDHIWRGPPADDSDRPATGITVKTMPLYGIEKVAGVDDALPYGHCALIPFRLYDDDRELYYEGTLDDDDDCENQSAALRWGEAMAGCAHIEVLRDGKWTQEIA